LSLPERHRDPIFLTNVRQALSTAEPGFSFNFGEQSRHTLRNACTEFVTDDDSDVCNLGSVNMANIDSITEFAAACNLGAQFLYCGTVTGLVPNEKSRATRDRNRRIGLGIMGVHEWLTKRGARYEVTPEMHQWLQAYAVEAKAGADTVADRGGLPRSKATRAIAPTGTIGMIAGTTTGIEPVFAVAYKRRYLKNGTDWHYQYVIDAAAKDLIERYSVNPDTIESAVDLAADFERRVKFQADVQDYVDMAISSTINLPAWGTDLNNEDRVVEYGEIISRYAPRLRGLTCYPDGSRGGQPLTSVPYAEAKMWEGVELKEHDSCKGGVCGV
jgi:ribonucleoside-diphosphate reductase alpha chain